MTFRGHVKQGVIVLDPPAQLPEGLEVEVRASEMLSVDAAGGTVDPQDDESAHMSGSISAAMTVLPQEDFTDWEK